MYVERSFQPFLTYYEIRDINQPHKAHTILSCLKCQAQKLDFKNQTPSWTTNQILPEKQIFS